MRRRGTGARFPPAKPDGRWHAPCTSDVRHSSRERSVSQIRPAVCRWEGSPTTRCAAVLVGGARLCLRRRDALSRGPAAPLALSKQKPTAATEQCTNGACHATVIEHKVMHGPAAQKKCTACHLYDEPRDHTFRFASAPDKMCGDCHVLGHWWRSSCENSRRANTPIWLRSGATRSLSIEGDTHIDVLREINVRFSASWLEAYAVAPCPIHTGDEICAAG